MKNKIFVLFSIITFPFITETNANFTDEDTIPTWGETAIEYVNENRVMTGFGDGSFRPWKELNRAEAVTLILRSKDIETENVMPHDFFADVTADMWYAKAVTVASEKGWVKGKNQTTFAPADRINRAEFATIMVRAFDIDTENFETTPEFRGVPSNAWYTPAVRALYENDLIRNPNSLFFYPEKNITRAEAAWVFAKILQMPRLNGSSEANDFTDSVKTDARRTAIRPRDFNKYKQGYDIAQKKVRINVQPNGEMIEMQQYSDWMDLGILQVENGLDDEAEIKSLHLRLRFNETNVGPAGNFIGKIIGINHDFEKEIHIARTGEMDVTGLSLHIEAGEVASFTLLLKPDNELQFYHRSGEAHFSISRAQAFSYHILDDTSSRTNNATAKTAPIIFEAREFSQIDFSPTIAID